VLRDRRLAFLAMSEVRTFRLADGTGVVAVRGPLDAAAIAEAGVEIERCGSGGRLVLDLLGVFHVDDSSVELLLPHLRDRTVTVVATHKLLVRVGLARGIRMRRTLAAALA